MVITFLLTQDYIPSLSAWIKKTVRRLSFFAGAEGFVLACRLGRCFCFAEVSTGDPHPSARGFGVNPRSQTPRAVSLRNSTIYQFLKPPKLQIDAILMLFKILRYTYIMFDDILML